MKEKNKYIYNSGKTTGDRFTELAKSIRDESINYSNTIQDLVLIKTSNESNLSYIAGKS